VGRAGAVEYPTSRRRRPWARVDSPQMSSGWGPVSKMSMSQGGDVGAADADWDPGGRWGRIGPGQRNAPFRWMLSSRVGAFVDWIVD
jgi:hypothetical protein